MLGPCQVCGSDAPRRGMSPDATRGVILRPLIRITSRTAELRRGVATRDVGVKRDGVRVAVTVFTPDRDFITVVFLLQG